MNEVQCLICNHGNATCIDINKNLYYCESCSKTFYTTRKNLNNFQTKIIYLSNLLKRLSFNCNLEIQNVLPKQKGNIFYIFYTQNNGIGLTAKQSEWILFVFKRYLVFLQNNNVNKFTSPYKLILYYIIKLNVINKNFNIQTKKKLELWEEFVEYLCDHIRRKQESIEIRDD